MRSGLLDLAIFSNWPRLLARRGLCPWALLALPFNPIVKEAHCCPPAIQAYRITGSSGLLSCINGLMS
jgi:hypothetical protein